MNYKVTTTRLSVLILILFCFACDNGKKNEQTSIVPASRLYPKIEIPAQSLVIVDLVNDKIEGQVAACALQGIVNRTSEEKIYVMNTLCRDNHGGWKDDTTDRQRSKQAQMGELWLKELFENMPQKRLETDSSKENPGFMALLEYALHYVKGIIIWDPKLEQATIEAAATIAGQTDGIIVSPDMAERLKGYNLPVIDDLQGKFINNIECLDWLIENYFEMANKQVAFTWSHMTTDPENSWGGANKDYVIANKLFTYFLDIQIKEECAYYETIVKKYPEGTPIMGWTDELKADKLFADYGYFMVPLISVENMTVMSSFPSVKGTMQTPKAYPIEDNAVYIALFISDGDNLLHTMIYEPYTIMHTDDLDAVTTTWIINPAITDLAPPVFKWYEEKLKNHEIAGMMGDGSPISERFAGFSFYCDFTKHYIKESGIRTIKHMVDAEAAAWRIQPYCMNGGYAGNDWRGIGVYDYHMDNQTFHIGTTSLRESLFNNTINNAPKGEPLFLCAFIGGSHHDAPKRIKEVAESIKSRNDGKKYYFVRSMDLAATYRAWKGLPNT